MKVVAATILHQPNRSARDYRGISAEYQTRLFQDDHDVRLYYAACYLNYKLDFLWRNQRIDSSLKIYRFYILSGIGSKILGQADIFNKKKSEIENAANLLIDICDNEKSLKAAIANVSVVVESRVKFLGIDGSRERLRDAIRSETFAKSFEADLSTATFSVKAE